MARTPNRQIEHLLRRAGFGAAWPCRYGQTGTGDPDIVSLDNRARESFFLEALA